jgi:hypothetical protein
MTVEDFAARALQVVAARLAGLPLVRRKPLAGVPQRIFSRGPISLIAPFLKIRFGSLRQKHLPCGLEIGAGFVEGRGRAVLMFARMRARIEATAPLPLIGVVWIAGADRDRAGVDIAVIDVPAFLADFRISAAGEFGHTPLKRGASL